MTNKPSYFDELNSKTGESWSAITKSRTEAKQHIEKLRNLIAEKRPSVNTSVVAYGSLARGEWTSGSDVDWTLLIDGPSSTGHFTVDTRNIELLLEESGLKAPGPTGTFGSMASSHELVHYIGGIEDTNQNLTRRMLLLLESVSLSDQTTHNRVVSAILERYIICDTPATNEENPYVPLFLFNDVVRFWRTMAVDYATKRWQRNSKGWALRNIKLRMSRKLLFVKGMLMCFLCHRDFIESEEGDLLNLCKGFAEQSAIDLLCHALIKFDAIELSQKIIGSYDHFLATLDDEYKRNKLKNLSFGDSNELFDEMRECTQKFRDGIIKLFFDSNEDLTNLTKKYGVF